MHRRRAPICAALGAAAVLVAAGPAPSPAEPADPPARGEMQRSRDTLRVVVYNAWHGLRTEGRFRLPGEGRERRDRRYAAQLAALSELDADVLLMQEVNPMARRARALARGLGMVEIHKVTSCGLHFGPLLKIPVNINEGLVVLARPELGLERIGFRLLSGKHRCWGDHLGFQTAESRYALLGSVRAGGRRLLLATTHLHAPPSVPEGFAESLGELVVRGVLAGGQRDEILAALEGHRARTRREAERLAGLVAELAPSYDAVLLGGDLNAEAGSPVLAAFLGGGAPVDLADPLAGREDELVTYDPEANAENYRIGARLEPSLPTFGIPEVEELLATRAERPRRIDWLLASPALEAIAGGVVLDRPRDGLYPSDHFGLLVELAIPQRALLAAAHPAGCWRRVDCS